MVSAIAFPFSLDFKLIELFCQPVITRNQLYGQYNCKILLSFYRFKLLTPMKVGQNSKIMITVMVKFMKALYVES